MLLCKAYRVTAGRKNSWAWARSTQREWFDSQEGHRVSCHCSSWLPGIPLGGCRMGLLGSKLTGEVGSFSESCPGLVVPGRGAQAAGQVVSGEAPGLIQKGVWSGSTLSIPELHGRGGVGAFPQHQWVPWGECACGVPPTLPQLSVGASSPGRNQLCRDRVPLPGRDLHREFQPLQPVHRLRGCI